MGLNVTAILKAGGIRQNPVHAVGPHVYVAFIGMKSEPIIPIQAVEAQGQRHRQNQGQDYCGCGEILPNTAREEMGGVTEGRQLEAEPVHVMRVHPGTLRSGISAKG